MSCLAIGLAAAACGSSSSDTGAESNAPADTSEPGGTASGGASGTTTPIAGDAAGGSTNGHGFTGSGGSAAVGKAGGSTSTGTAGAWNGASGGSGGAWSGSAGSAGSTQQPAAGSGGASTAGAGGSSAGSGGAAGNAGNAGANACAMLDSSMPTTLYQSADDSNSMASPVQIRRELNHGYLPQPWIVRPYEFLNYYRFDYDPADAGHVRVVPELRKQDDGSLRLQVGIVSPPAISPRRPMNLTFVLDTSGSMGQDGRIERLKAAVKTIVGQLASGDIVSMVTWNTAQTVQFAGYVVPGPNDPSLLSYVDGLSPDGGTDLDGGLQKGYELANASYSASRMNRVLMISDGEANVGQTDGNIIGMASHTQDDEGIYLVGVNVGAEAGDALMNTVTDMGRGASVFLDSEEEAQRMFGQRFDETMEIAARGVRLELTVPWYLQLKTFSGEQSSTNPKAVDPQHLAPNDAMVFNEQFVACDPSLIQDGDPLVAKATWQTPILHEDRADEADTTLGQLLASPAPHLAKGTAIYDYAVVLRELNSVSHTETKMQIAKVLAEIDGADPTGTDSDLTEIRGLLNALDGML